MDEIRHQNDAHIGVFFPDVKGRTKSKEELLLAQQIAEKKREDYLKQIEGKYKKIIEYNKSLLVLNPLYSNLKLYNLRDVLVRVFLNEPKLIQNGLLLPGVDQVQVKTQNGQGVKENIDNPFPFKRLAVVVALNENNQSLKIGDVVLINQIFTVAPIPGNSSVLEYQFMFLHHSYNDPFPPKDISNPHFGYAMLPNGGGINAIEGTIFNEV